MAIDRTLLNAATASNGTPGHGTVIDRAFIADREFDPIDAEIARLDAAVIAAGTPGGSTTQVQFNDAGAFGGDAGLTYAKASDALTTGKLAVTQGQIDFPAVQNPSAGANTLDDYEEGTWTPTDNSGAALGLTPGTCSYTKIGRLVHVTCSIVYPSTADGSNTEIAGLPFTSANLVGMGGQLTFSNVATPVFIYVNNSATTIRFYNGTTRYTNANFSGKTLQFFAVYAAAN